MNKGLFLFGLLFALGGGVFASIGIKSGIDTRSFLSTAIPAQGTVIDLVESSSTTKNRTSYTYRPVVKFTTNLGEPTIFESKAGSNPPSFTKGQQVEVLYNPQNPQSAVINAWFDIWGLSAVFTGIGSAFVISGGCVMGSSFLFKN
ncbi:MAG TPA: DUF3592 domain-containing protein [Nostocaceae cyanobacterium]|nr:DUF3592 domain-containing protein [Nostocaceae cyanobacterium]